MPSFAQREQLCLILAVFCGSSFCEGLIKLEGRESPYLNSTSTTKPSSLSITPIVNAALITPTPQFSGSSASNYSSTITSAPVYPWGNQSIPINTCSVTASGGDIQWTPCAIFAGTVQMSYFLESKGNLSYPATYWNPDFGVTMTSPSIYMMVNTVTGENDCGPLGPTYSNKVISMDLTDVSTLQAYADHTVTTRMGPPQQLTLSDLTSNCLNTYSTFSTDGAFVNTHPVYGNYNRCHPRFVFPIQLKRIGYPYWMHCGPYNYTYGIFDPPGAVPPVVGLLPTTSTAPYTSTYEPASALPTTAPVQETSMPAQPTTSPVSTPLPPVPATSSNQRDPPVFTPSISTPSIPVPTSATAIATVGGETISAIPGSSGVVLPNGSTAKPGSVETVTDSNSQGVVVSVGTSGIYIGGTSSGDSVSYVANPTIPPVAIATVASQVISAAPGATNIVVGSQTASLGGPPITVSDAVIQLTPSGLVVSDGSNGGAPSTYAIPTLAHDVVPPTAIATIGGQVISAAPGDSTVVINGQVVTSGGAPVTLAGSNNVASLGANGLVVQYPSGSVSTYTLPTAAPSVGAIVGTVGGIAVSASAGASVISIGNQGVTLGGSVVTVGNDVVSFGPSGLVVQMPGGGVTTLSGQAKTSTAAGVVTSMSTGTSSTKGIASIIASIAGASQTGKGSGSSSSSSSAAFSSPTPVTTSAGGRVGNRSYLVSMWAVFCTGLGLVLGV